MTTDRTSRRDLIASAVLGGALLAARADGAEAQGTAMTTTIYELRTYRLVRGGDQAQRLAAYLRDALLPAARRAGCGPIGVFSLSTGQGSPAIYVLIPHPSLESVLSLPEKLAADVGYRGPAEPFLAAMATDPPYLSLDVKLMRGFPHFPKVEPPPAQPRLFELRTYHSHSQRAGAKKIEMFDTAGEIAIFRRNGLTPVFFAQDLTGPALPSLTYMLTYPSLAAREQVWRAFAADPEWKTLSTTPGFTDPEIVSGIDSLYLSPAPYSQI